MRASKQPHQARFFFLIKSNSDKLLIADMLYLAKTFEIEIHLRTENFFDAVVSRVQDKTIAKKAMIKASKA